MDERTRFEATRQYAVALFGVTKYFSAMPNPVLDELRRRVRENSQADVADALGISASYLNDLLHRRRLISKQVERKLGFERIVTYRQRAGAGQPQTETEQA